MSNAWPGSFRKSRHSLRTSGQLTTKLKFCTSDWASPSSGTATAIVLLPFSAPGCAGHAPSNNRKPFARVCTVSTREFSPFSLSFLTRIACIPGVELSPDWADAFHVAHFSCTKGTSAFSNAVDSLLTTCCVRLEPGECLPLRRLPASPLQLPKRVPKWCVHLQEGRAGMLRSVRVCVFFCVASFSVWLRKGKEKRGEIVPQLLQVRVLQCGDTRHVRSRRGKLRACTSGASGHQRSGGGHIVLARGSGGGRMGGSQLSW